MMKIYLDNCSLQRPLDDRTQIRVEKEAEAVIEILSLCESGKVTLVSSEILQFEIRNNSDSERRETAFGILKIARENIAVNKEIENRAQEFENDGIKPIDALHLACAEIEKIDYFCTCDDKFLKKARTLIDLNLKIVSPIELKEILQ